MIICKEVNNSNIKERYYIETLDIMGNNNWDKIYFDISFIETKLSYNDSKLFFDFKLNIITRCKLPLGTFLMNIRFPGQEVKNIMLYDSLESPTNDTGVYPTWIAKIFKASVEVDIAENIFFHREILNEIIKVNFDFDLNIESFENYDIDYTNESINPFFSEVKNKKLESFFKYSNTLEIKKNGNYKLPIINFFDTNGLIRNEYIDIKFILPNYYDENRFNKLFYLSTNSKYVNIYGFKINLYFSYGSQVEEFLLERLESNLVDDFFTLFLKKNLIYDFLQKKFKIIDGDIGLVFPFETKGNYRVKFNINVSGKNFIIYLNNKFDIKKEFWIRTEKVFKEDEKYEKI